VIGAVHDRCPACGALLSPPQEGALAPDPLSVTPPAQRKPEPIREIPALRKREPTWKDEVRERVKHRRRERSGVEGEDDLPLFRENEEEAEPLPDGAPAVGEHGPERPDPYAITERMEPRETLMRESGPSALGEDLPLRPVEAQARGLDEDALEGSDALAEGSRPSWPLELDAPAAREPRPVERPARPAERLRASAIDLGFLVLLWGVVTYFASRTLHVSIAGLRPTWGYLGGYLAFLGLAYAVYFTGTTGQTPGKMASGLRVVDVAGRPPGHTRALLRVLLAVVGIATLGAGVLLMFFDPARRAFHDRLLKTRVVKG
jgi:uncharacterized RDD family membrane protein YckC